MLECEARCQEGTYPHASARERVNTGSVLRKSANLSRKEKLQSLQDRFNAKGKNLHIQRWHQYHLQRSVNLFRKSGRIKHTLHSQNSCNFENNVYEQLEICKSRLREDADTFWCCPAGHFTSELDSNHLRSLQLPRKVCHYINSIS